MTQELVKKFLQPLEPSTNARREMTVKLSGEVLAIVEQWRRPTVTQKGKVGRLQSYSEVVTDLVRVAHEHLVEAKKKLASQNVPQGK